MSESKIDILGLGDIPLVIDLYNRIYHPRRDETYFQDRLADRRNVVIFAAIVNEHPIGFFLGYEERPGVFFEWLYGVLPEYRGQGIASRLQSAANTWAKDNGYTSSRLECHNQHRPLLHLAIAHGYDILGIRWDPELAANLVIFERPLIDHDY